MEVANNMVTTMGMRITRALLIYESPTMAAATMHDVTEGKKGNPVILAGHPAESAAVIDIMKTIIGTPQSTRRTILDPQLLVSDADLLAWYRPSHRRTIHFKVSTGRVRDYENLTGRNALHPTLLFIAKPKNLYVFALADTERPTEQTRIYRAPYLNIYAGGHLCEGSVKVPEHCRPDGIPAWEHAFFETSFSHSNTPGEIITPHPGGHLGLWQEMCVDSGRRAPKLFRAEYLTPLNEEMFGGKAKTPLTLGRLIQA